MKIINKTKNLKIGSNVLKIMYMDHIRASVPKGTQDTDIIAEFTDDEIKVTTPEVVTYLDMEVLNHDDIEENDFIAIKHKNVYYKLNYVSVGDQ